MSFEVQSRPAASRGGRGATRGGRGGFAGRESTRRSNGNAKNQDNSSQPSLEDEGEIGQLKKLYGAKTVLIREMFPDWSEVDILFALRETDGDENLTVTRIAEGEFTALHSIILSRFCIVPTLYRQTLLDLGHEAMQAGRFMFRGNYPHMSPNITRSARCM